MLDKGVVIAGDIKIKLCDIELLSIQIRLLVASVDKAKEMGLTWWWQSAAEPPPRPTPWPAASRRWPPRRPRPPGNRYTEFREDVRSGAE